MILQNGLNWMFLYLKYWNDRYIRITSLNINQVNASKHFPLPLRYEKFSWFIAEKVVSNKYHNMKMFPKKPINYPQQSSHIKSSKIEIKVVTLIPFQVTIQPDSFIRKCSPSKLIFSSVEFMCRAVLMNLRDNLHYITTTVVKNLGTQLQGDYATFCWIVCTLCIVNAFPFKIYIYKR